MIYCQDVLIVRKLNGFLVRVGCSEFVFSLKEENEFYTLLKLYFREPEKAMELATVYEYALGPTEIRTSEAEQGQDAGQPQVMARR